MRVPALYYYGLAAICVLSLFVGLGHAADLSPSQVNLTKIHGGFGHSPMPRLNLSCLEQQGVTIADLKAAQEHNDTALLMTWRDACGQSPKGISGNAIPRQQPNFRTGSVPFARNATKTFPAGNLSKPTSIPGKTPGSPGGNITRTFPVADAALLKKGSLQNGTILHHALNGSGVGLEKAVHLNRNTTTLEKFPGQNHRIFPGGVAGVPRSGPLSVVNGTLPHMQPAI